MTVKELRSKLFELDQDQDVTIEMIMELIGEQK